LVALNDEFTECICAAADGMMFDVLAPVHRKDYDGCLRRQGGGRAKAKGERRYRGRQANVGRNAGIASMLRAAASGTRSRPPRGCGPAHTARIKKRLSAEVA
jgi:hypothetical protein